MPVVWSMRMSSGASCAYAKPRSASSSCMEETPRSKRTPWTRGMASRSSTSPISSYTACTSVARSPYGARRSPASSRAAGSRSRATSRAAGKVESSASLCPPRPRVQSTTTAPGSASAGASTSRQRWSITGTCRASLAMRPSEGFGAGPCAPPGPRPLEGESGRSGAGEVTSGDRSGRRPSGTYAPRTWSNRFQGERHASHFAPL